MKIFLTYRERAAGIFLLTAILLVLAFVVGAAAKNRWFAPRVSYHTLVERGDGLREGSPVLLSGVEVGEIGRVTILDDDRLDVELLILRQHAHRVREGTTAVVRRLLGIGEKRIHLSTPRGEVKPAKPSSRIPAEEPLDLIDVVGTLNLGQSLRVMERALDTMEKLFGTLDQDSRLDRMISVMDRIGPTMEKVDALLDDVHEPLVAVISDPNLPKTLRGASAVLNDPATRKTLQSTAKLLDPERMDALLARTESLLGRMDALTAKDGSLTHTLESTNRLLSDGRADRLISSIERLTDEKKLGRIVDNMAVLAEQMARIGPAIPSITRDMQVTLQEAVVVLKALQKTWILDDEAASVRREQKRK